MHKALIGTVHCYRRLFVGKTTSRRDYMGDITTVSPLMLALFSPNVKASPDKHNHLMIDDSIPLQFSGAAKAASTFLEFKKVWDVALLTGMQKVADNWSSEKDKRVVYKRGITEVILSAAQELLQYEEGQAKRREEDVNKFLLKEKQERDEGIPNGDKKFQKASKYTRPARNDRSRYTIDKSSRSSLVCSICGQRGHEYDDCPRSQATSSGPTTISQNVRPAWDMAWGPATEESKEPAPWSPTFEPEKEEGNELSELPS